MKVGIVRFTSAPAPEWPSGLLGWVRFQYGDLLVEGAVRVTTDLRLVLSFPRRKGRTGDYPYVRPVDAEARRRIEGAVLEALLNQGGAP